MVLLDGLTPVRELLFGSPLILKTVGLDCSLALTCIPELREGRGLGKTISGTGFTDMGVQAGVGL